MPAPKVARWTVERVKEELPTVTVEVGGLTLTGRVVGRNMPYAQVWMQLPVGNTKINHTAECAWETVAHALNSGGKLRY